MFHAHTLLWQTCIHKSMDEWSITILYRLVISVLQFTDLRGLAPIEGLASCDLKLSIFCPISFKT